LGTGRGIFGKEFGTDVNLNARKIFFLARKIFFLQLEFIPFGSWHY
jgi:hypothetical protein